MSQSYDNLIAAMHLVSCTCDIRFETLSPSMRAELNRVLGNPQESYNQLVDKWLVIAKAGEFETTIIECSTGSYHNFDPIHSFWGKMACAARQLEKDDLKIRATNNQLRNALTKLLSIDVGVGVDLFADLYIDQLENGTFRVLHKGEKEEEEFITSKIDEAVSRYVRYRDEFRFGFDYEEMASKEL